MAMSKQPSDPAYLRVTGSQSWQLVKGYMATMVLLVGGMLFDLVMFFYTNMTWGALAGIAAGGLGAGGIVGGLGAYYFLGVITPASAGLNLSAQIFELPELGWGLWAVNDQPLVEIPMSDEERKMPARIPVGILGKKTAANPAGQIQQATDEGVTMIEEVHGTCPSCSKQISLDTGEIYHRLPFLEFETYGYVMTPNPGSTPFEKAIIISPCKIDSLRTIRDLIFFKSMPVMARTTYVTLCRVFEMDTGTEFSAPAYVITSSSWHIELTQRLAGFTPAYMVPNMSRIVEIYNMWGITEAMKLKQQLATAKSRIDSLEANQPEFRMALEAGIAHERKQEELIDMFPRTIRTRWLQPKYLVLMAVAVISTIIITYMLTIGFK